jgi:K+-transporting ATPase ATPase C chain
MTDDARPGCARPLLPALWSATRLTVALLLLTGVAFPAVLWGLARLAFPWQAEGSLLRDAGGRVVGSALIGQAFAAPRYFHGRPSAVAYAAAASGGSNIGPTNPQLLAGNGGSYAGVAAYAARFRAANGLAASAPLPVDVATASGSGLDPHVSPAAAELQVARVAAARAPALDAAAVRALVRAHTRGRTLGLLGEPRVNVLTLNLALDSASARARGGVR